MAAKKKTKAKAEVAVVEEGTTAVALATEAYDYGDMAGAGMEDVSRDELALPLLTIAQSSSKVVKDPDSPVTAGQLLNSVSNKAIDAARKQDEGAIFVPAFMTRAWVRWTPENKFAGIMSTKKVPDDCSETTAAIANAKEFGKNILENGDSVVYTVYINGFELENVGDSYGKFCLVPFKSTQHKHLKPLITMLKTHQIATPDGLRRINPPMFANQLRIKTKLETNAKGDAFGYDITFAVNDDIKASLLPASINGALNPLFKEAIAFEKSFTSEQLNDSVSKAGNEDVAEESSGFTKSF